MVWVWKLRGSGTSDGHGFRLKDNISQHHNGPDPSQILMVLFRVLVCVCSVLVVFEVGAFSFSLVY